MKRFVLVGLAAAMLWAPALAAAPEAPEPTPLPSAARVVARPLWKLPEVLRSEGSLAVSAQVEVEIYSDGTTSCRLLRTTGRPEVDAMLLGWLKGWTWQPATSDGRPVHSVEQFDVDLRVE